MWIISSSGFWRFLASDKMVKEYVLRNFMLQPLFDEICGHQERFISISFSYIYKKRNHMADRLSKEGHSLARSDRVVMEDQAGLSSEFTHACFY